MENKLLLVKVVLFGMIGGAVDSMTFGTLEIFVMLLQITFYSIGSYVLYTSAYDWHKKKKNEKV